MADKGLQKLISHLISAEQHWFKMCFLIVWFTSALKYKGTVIKETFWNGSWCSSVWQLNLFSHDDVLREGTCLAMVILRNLVRRKTVPCTKIFSVVFLTHQCNNKNLLKVYFYLRESGLEKRRLLKIQGFFTSSGIWRWLRTWFESVNSVTEKNYVAGKSGVQTPK